jgi:TonB family protein
MVIFIKVFAVLESNTMRSCFLTLSRTRFLFVYLVLMLVIGATISNGQDSKPAAKQPRTFVFSGLAIQHKPTAGYTEAARTNRVEGLVRLLVMFRATGEIGDVTVLTPLPHGLTERAVDAARRIKFTPKSLNGTPMDEQTTVEYNFRLYYDNEDADIKTKVEIQSVPKPSLAASDIPASFGGKIPVKVFFSSRGNASVFEMPAGLSSVARIKLEDAVKKIKFRPAVHIGGNKMSVTKEVVYAL